MKKGIGIYLIILGISIYIGSQWNELPALKNSVHAFLDPTAGALLQWNVYVGFAIVVAIISFILTLAQRFFVDQKEMKALKDEQKFIQSEMKKYAEHPEKLMEFQKRQLQTVGKTFHLMTRSFMITAIPIILFFRWFQEILLPVFGSWWILYYIVATLIFSSIFRKVLGLA